MKKACKFTVCVVLVLTCFITLAGCRDMSKRDINYLISHAPQFDGTVQSVTEDYILLDLGMEDPLHTEYPTIRVSLNVIRSDSGTHFNPGDQVCVLYDGTLTDEDPVTAETVYAILLSRAAKT